MCPYIVSSVFLSYRLSFSYFIHVQSSRGWENKIVIVTAILSMAFKASLIYIRLLGWHYW